MGNMFVINENKLKDIEIKDYYRYIQIFQRKFKIHLRADLTSITRDDKKTFLFCIDLYYPNNPHPNMCPWVKTRAEALYNAYLKIQNPELVLSKK